MTLNDNIGLVLEGGGLRGIYTAGILDWFNENNIIFKHCIGVSAGICNGVSYISNQKFRSRDINLKYVNDKRYLSIGNLLKNGSIFGYDMMLNKIPNELMPFDYDAYENSPCTLTAGVTNCSTGACEYFPLKNLRDNYNIVQATSSLPMISNIVDINGKKYLDGGISDSIPIRKSISDGNGYNVVVLTRAEDYRKSPSNLTFIKHKYKQYPNFIHAVEIRHNMYNSTLEYINDLERQGKVFVFRPSSPPKVSRLEKNVEKLTAVYNMAAKDAVNNSQRFFSWLDSIQ